jgi:2-oxoglutarate dehydrogenase E2 component (dihydrolipoamide succinyltransferase)
MAIEMKVPAVGESITEVTVATWNKKEGDHVKLDEVLCELESDKATFELPAEAEGVLHIVAKEGDVLPIGAIICTIEAGGATASVKVADAAPAAAVAAPAAAPAPAAGPTSVLEVKVPAVGESITEVTVSVWNKKTGDSVSLDEVLCELESDKATFELPAESAGVLEIVAESGTVVPIGGILARITVGGSVAAAAPAPAAAPAAPVSAGDATYAAGHPSPAAAKILDEKGISAASVAGSGVGLSLIHI